MKCLDSITDAMNVNSGKLREMVRGREAWCPAGHGGLKELDTTFQLKQQHIIQQIIQQRTI